jgi:hypothetical protein
LPDLKDPNKNLQIIFSVRGKSINPVYEGWVLSYDNYFFPSCLNDDTTK